MNGTETIGAEVYEWTQKHGVCYAPEFVPFSRSRSAKPNPRALELSINWRLVFTKGGRAFSVDYSQGIGHLPKDLQIPYGKGGATVHQYEQIQRAVESGKHCGWSLVPPSLVDVLACIVLDAGVLDEMCFQDWAQSLGYDTDSRAAEATYNACREQALGFRALVGGEAFQDLLQLDFSEV